MHNKTYPVPMMGEECIEGLTLKTFTVIPGPKAETFSDSAKRFLKQAPRIIEQNFIEQGFAHSDQSLRCALSG